ncbi:TPA: hypothetical protein N0F65_011043, partial [Lagenidium giganteum]
SIERNRKERTIFIHQHKYTINGLDRFRHLINYPVATPSDPCEKLSTTMQLSTPAGQDAMKENPYREAVDSVIYLMVGTRPDRAFFIQNVSEYLAIPGKEHWHAIIQGLKYLNGTEELGVTKRVFRSRFSASQGSRLPEGGASFRLLLLLTSHCVPRPRKGFGLHNPRVGLAVEALAAVAAW